jgi:hypothetical protein
MIYRKPEIAKLGPALNAVRGQTKMGAVPDAFPPHNRPSISAYEADE